MPNDIRDSVECIILDYCDCDEELVDTLRVSGINKSRFCEHRRRPGRRALPQQCADRLVAYVEELVNVDV